MVQDAATQQYIHSSMDAIRERLILEKKGNVQLSFYQTVTKKDFFWTMQKKVVWEQWSFPLQLEEKPKKVGRQRRDAYLCTMMNILQTLDQKFEHIPSSVTHELPSFEIQFVSIKRSDSSSMNIRRMLSDASGLPRFLNQ